MSIEVIVLLLGIGAQTVGITVFLVRMDSSIRYLAKTRVEDKKMLDDHANRISDHEVRVSIMENQIA